MGFIGLHTARRFLDQGHDVVVTYHANRREPDFLRPTLAPARRSNNWTSSTRPE